MNERPTRQPQQASSDILHGVLLRGLQQAPKADAINPPPPRPPEPGGIKTRFPLSAQKTKVRKFKNRHTDTTAQTLTTRGRSKVIQLSFVIFNLFKMTVVCGHVSMSKMKIKQELKVS